MSDASLNLIADVEVSADAAEFICHYLESLGVEYVFGLPGGPLEPLFSALSRSQRRGKISPIVSRHEAGAAFMAEGYARETGKLGVCCSTTGPGATNMITGVSSAFQDNIPLLVITAQSALKSFGKRAFQESSCTGVDTVSMYRHCTRYSTLVYEVPQLPFNLHAAITTAFGPNRGPAHLSIPFDVLNGSGQELAISADSPVTQGAYHIVDMRAVNRLSELLQGAKRPVILIGGCAAPAMGQIVELATVLQAPIISTPQGKGLINVRHALYRGVFGFAGHKTAYDLLGDPSVDLVVAIGTTLDEYFTSGWSGCDDVNAKIVHVDSIPDNFRQSRLCKLHVLGDMPTIFDYLTEKIPGTKNITVVESAQRRQANATPVGQALKLVSHLNEEDKIFYQERQFALDDEGKCYSSSSPIKPQRLMYEVSRRFPPSTRFLPEIGNATLWAVHYLQPRNRRLSGCRSSIGGTIRLGLGYAAMGWGLGGSIGTALGSRTTPVVAIVGDGSLLMNGQELTVALQNQLTVIFIVMNDGALGTVKHGQRLAGAEEVGYELPRVDFSMFANSMGIDAIRITHPDEFDDIDYDALCNKQGPTLIDVVIDPDEMPPLSTRIKTICWSKGNDSH